MEGDAGWIGVILPRLPVDACRWAANSQGKQALPCSGGGCGKGCHRMGESLPRLPVCSRPIHGSLLGEWVALVEISSSCHFLPDEVQPKKGPEKTRVIFTY